MDALEHQSKIHDFHGTGILGCVYTGPRAFGSIQSHFQRNPGMRSLVQRQYLGMPRRWGWKGRKDLSQEVHCHLTRWLLKATQARLGNSLQRSFDYEYRTSIMGGLSYWHCKLDSLQRPFGDEFHSFIIVSPQLWALLWKSYLQLQMETLFILKAKQDRKGLVQVYESHRISSSGLFRSY